jgi:hypothetical protein
MINHLFKINVYLIEIVCASSTGIVLETKWVNSYIVCASTTVIGGEARCVCNYNIYIGCDLSTGLGGETRDT